HIVWQAGEPEFSSHSWERSLSVPDSTGDRLELSDPWWYTTFLPFQILDFLLNFSLLSRRACFDLHCCHNKFFFGQYIMLHVAEFIENLRSHFVNGRGRTSSSVDSVVHRRIVGRRRGS
ncbi:hypothetical protein T310_8728, partial [Rasamsonia emersonii CBS 393.64]